MVDVPHTFFNRLKMCVILCVRRHLFSIYVRSLQCQGFVIVRSKALLLEFMTWERFFQQRDLQFLSNLVAFFSSYLLQERERKK